MGISGKAQISVEYLITIGFVTVALVPLILVYYTYTIDSNDEVVSTQLDKLAKEIVDAAEQVYFLGEPSLTTINLYVPGDVESVSLANFEIAFNISTSRGVTEVYQSSQVNISGDLPTKKGVYTLTIRALDGYVNISYS